MNNFDAFSDPAAANSVQQKAVNSCTVESLHGFVRYNFHAIWNSYPFHMERGRKKQTNITHELIMALDVSVSLQLSAFRCVWLFARLRL